MKLAKVVVSRSVFALVLGFCFVNSASAETITVYTSPTIVAGAPPDSPAARVDSNVATSPFSGVVSINIRYGNGVSFICSGTLVSSRDVVTAGHCLDVDGNGTLIDITQPGADVRVVFNAGSGAGSAVVLASSVSMNPDYDGFGNCPDATMTEFCVNDDIAVIHLSQDAPAAADIYKIYSGLVDVGELATLVGYGNTGTGIARIHRRCRFPRQARWREPHGPLRRQRRVDVGWRCGSVVCGLRWRRTRHVLHLLQRLHRLARQRQGSDDWWGRGRSRILLRRLRVLSDGQ